MTKRPVSRCRYPWQSVQIGTYGAVKPCCFARHNVGSVAEEDLEHVWNGPVMRQLRGAIRDGFVHPFCRGAACCFAYQTERLFGLDAYDLRYDCGTLVDFQGGEDGWRFLVDGWSAPEGWGVWSDGPSASIVFNLASRPGCALKLSAEGFGFCVKGHRRADVELVVGGKLLARWRFFLVRKAVRRSLIIPVELVSTQIKVTFRIMNPEAPSVLGLSKDRRLLGLALQRLWLRPVL